MTVHLTDTAITKAAREAAATGTRSDLSDAACRGLRVRLTPSGTKTWVLACRDHEGRMRRFPLGRYPAVSISQARRDAQALHVRVQQTNEDPIADRKRQRSVAKDAKAGVGTLGALVATYEVQRGQKLKSWPECRRRIESVFRDQLSRPLASLMLADLQIAADGWPSQQSASAAVRYVRPILKWAAHRGYVAADLTTLSPPAAVERRDRLLSRAELTALLPALTASPRPYAACMKFMLLTLARREEAAAARWRDIDIDRRTWTIPETKNGQPHVVPLSDQAAALLRLRLPPAHDGSAPGSDPEALVFAARTGARLGNWDRETKAIQTASGTQGWTRHDLRRTGATMLGDMGELPDIIEAALNHVSIRSALAATYNRSRYRPQVAAALQRLGDELDRIEAGDTTVLTFRRLG